MAFTRVNKKNTLLGIIFVAIFASVATIIADISTIKALGISPLVIGIVMGIFYANTLHNNISKQWEAGITFSGKKILRFGIVFYGFRITFQEIADVGMSGFMVSLIMLASTFIMGSLALCVSIIPMGPDVQGIVSRFSFQNRLAYDADNSQFLH